MLRDEFVYSHARKFNMLYPGHVKHADRHQPHDRCMHWGQRLKIEREALGLSQKEVGAFAGVTKGAVSQWEAGGSIKPENLFAIADRLNLSPKWLAIGRGSKKPDESNLTSDEIELLQFYRKLTGTFQAMLLADARKYFSALPKGKLDQDGDLDLPRLPQ